MSKNGRGGLHYVLLVVAKFAERNDVSCTTDGDTASVGPHHGLVCV